MNRRCLSCSVVDHGTNHSRGVLLGRFRRWRTEASSGDFEALAAGDAGVRVVLVQHGGEEQQPHLVAGGQVDTDQARSCAVIDRLG